MSRTEGPMAREFAPLLAGMGAVFESLGRALVCLGPDFRVVHHSPGLARLIGLDDHETDAIRGTPIEELLGPELFGPDGALRRALAEGDRREGWGATLRFGAAPPRLVSVTAAPLLHAEAEGGAAVCDPRVAYIVVLRPAEASDEVGSGAPTMFSGLIARSAPMLAIFRLIENLSASEATVLLTGESGTGKELLARALHDHSPRRRGPFVAVNCGALPGELLESEMFGHVRGSFTGAVRDRAGRFELAAGGTLFLDEVGDLPLALQVKLLRALQERTYERVGESATRRADVRIVAATNKDLKRAIAEGHFRDDLYYRLRVVPVEVPPLRARRADIEPLARMLLSRVEARYGRVLRLGPDALQAILRHPWPGNVRELENALEYAVAVCRGQTLHREDLPAEILADTVAPSEGIAPPATSSRPAAAAESAERDRLRAALEAHRWRRDEAAGALGMSRSTLWRKMRELGLTR